MPRDRKRKPATRDSWFARNARSSGSRPCPVACKDVIKKVESALFTKMGYEPAKTQLAKTIVHSDLFDGFCSVGSYCSDFNNLYATGFSIFAICLAKAFANKSCGRGNAIVLPKVPEVGVLLLYRMGPGRPALRQDGGHIDGIARRRREAAHPRSAARYSCRGNTNTCGCDQNSI